MNKLNFKDLNPSTKKDMSELISRWKRTRTSVHVLVESLSALASEKRLSANNISIAKGHDIASIAVAWGKGNRSKLALGKEHACLLLGLASSIEDSAKEDRSLALRMVEVADSVLLKGGKPPSTITDPSWGPVFKLMSSLDPNIGQKSLF